VVHIFSECYLGMAHTCFRWKSVYLSIRARLQEYIYIL
jgi:hypothetical protein